MKRISLIIFSIIISCTLGYFLCIYTVTTDNTYLSIAYALEVKTDELKKSKKIYESLLNDNLQEKNNDEFQIKKNLVHRKNYEETISFLDKEINKCNKKINKIYSIVEKRQLKRTKS